MHCLALQGYDFSIERIVMRVMFYSADYSADYSNQGSLADIILIVLP